MWPGNNLSKLEWKPREEYQSAGLPTTDLGRQKSDLIVDPRDRRERARREQEALRAVAVDPRHRARRRRGRHPRDGRDRHRGRTRDAETTRSCRKEVARERADLAPRSSRTRSSTSRSRTRTAGDVARSATPRRARASSSSATTATGSTRTATGRTSATRSAPTAEPLSPRRARSSDFYRQVEARGGQFAAGDDLHGQPFADALSYTLMPHGRHDIDKDYRIREASKLINRAQYEATKWSPYIIDNDEEATVCEDTLGRHVRRHLRADVGLGLRHDQLHDDGHARRLVRLAASAWARTASTTRCRSRTSTATSPSSRTASSCTSPATRRSSIRTSPTCCARPAPRTPCRSRAATWRTRASRVKRSRYRPGRRRAPRRRTTSRPRQGLQDPTAASSSSRSSATRTPTTAACAST